MKLSKEVFDKVKEYQKLKSKTESLKSEIKELIEKEYLEQTGFTTGIGIFEPFISDSVQGEKQEETGTYVQEVPKGYIRYSKYWYAGEEFIPVEGSDEFVELKYER